MDLRITPHQRTSRKKKFSFFLQLSEMPKVFAECLYLELQRLVLIFASFSADFLNEGYGLITARGRTLYLETMQATVGTLLVIILVMKQRWEMCRHFLPL